MGSILRRKDGISSVWCSRLTDEALYPMPLRHQAHFPQRGNRAVSPVPLSGTAPGPTAAPPAGAVHLSPLCRVSDDGRGGVSVLELRLAGVYHSGESGGAGGVAGAVVRLWIRV